MKHTYKLIVAIVFLGFVNVATAENPFQQAYEKACTGDGANAASCRAWAEQLQKSPQGNSEDAQLKIGAAYVELQFLGANEQDKATYRARAREVYAAIVKQNPTSIEAVTGLANAADTEDERIAYLRQRLALDPTDVTSLNFLSEAVKDAGEAGELRERAFEHSPNGAYKWNQASLAIFLYGQAGREADADAMRGSARAAYGYDDVVARLSRPELMNAEDLNSTLTSICSFDVVKFGGAKGCLDSLKTTVDAIDSVPANSAGKLADAASLGIQTAAPHFGLGNKSLTDSLEKIIASGHATPNTFGAYGALVPDRRKRLEVMEAGAAKFPNDAGLAIAAGLAELDVGNRDDAVRNLTRAKGLATDTQQPAIDRWIEKAQAPR
jgi:tetratricopeptide (TPR) repeat protein